MTLAAVLFIAPLFIIVNYSFKGKRELYLSSPPALPESLNFGNYAAVYKKPDLGTTFINTLFYTITGVIILALLCGMTAWEIAISALHLRQMDCRLIVRGSVNKV